MKLLRLLLKYARYLIIAKSKYNLHSPFLFKLVTNVILKKGQDLKEIIKLRNQLSENNTTINIKDFGTGSNINNSKKRKIKDIAKNSAKNSKFGMLIYRVVSFFKPEIIIELGTSLGISTCYLAKGNKDAKIYTFEGCPETIKIAQENFLATKNLNIEVIEGNFDITLEKKLAEIPKVDLAFVDGNHNLKSTIKYFDLILKYTKDNSILIFDDIHWSDEMEEAWEIIKDSPKVKLSIDLFFIGLVFTNKKLSKENYIIRF